MKRLFSLLLSIPLLLSTALSVLLFAGHGWGATYYIRDDGSAANKAAATGCADASTAMSIATHNTETFAPDDTIYLCTNGGSNIRGKLIVPSSGTEGHPITYSNVTSQTPALNGSQVVANASFALTSGKTNTYEISHTLGTYLVEMVWESGTRLTSRASIDLVEANAGSFYYDSTAHIIYIHGVHSDSPITNARTYELPQVPENFWDNGKDYIVLDGITCKRTSSDNSNSVGGISLTGSHNIVKNLTSFDHRRHALTFYDGGSYNTAENVTMYDAWSSATIAFYNSDNNILRNSDISTGAAVGVVYAHGTSTGNVIENVNIYNSTTSGYLLRFDSSGNTARRCKLYGISANGIRLDGANNKIYSNQIILDQTTAGGLIINSVGNEIHNNTIIGPLTGVYMIAVAATATGNKVKNNIGYNIDRWMYVADGGQVDFESDYNNVYQILTRWGNWRGSLKATLAIWQSASSQDAHSFSADPKFRSTTDFSLQPSSPCINKGVSIGLTTDFLGKNISGIPDIGAYEYYGSRNGSAFGNLNFSFGW